MRKQLAKPTVKSADIANEPGESTGAINMYNIEKNTNEVVYAFSKHVRYANGKF